MAKQCIDRRGSDPASTPNDGAVFRRESEQDRFGRRKEPAEEKQRDHGEEQQEIWGFELRQRFKSQGWIRSNRFVQASVGSIATD